MCTSEAHSTIQLPLTEDKMNRTVHFEINPIFVIRVPPGLYKYELVAVEGLW